MAKDLAIVLNNGSLNSAVVTALAAQKYRVVLVYAETSSTPTPRHRWAYDQQVGFFKPYREHTLAMPFITALHPTAGPQHVDPRQSGQLGPQLVDLLGLIGAAASFAAGYQAAAIYTGLRVGPNPEELARATEFMQIMTELLQLPCGQSELEVQSPLLELELWQTVDAGVQVGAPLDKTWSCQDQGAEPCGSCRGCRMREAAFQQAVKPDPGKGMRRT